MLIISRLMLALQINRKMQQFMKFDSGPVNQVNKMAHNVLLGSLWS